MLDNTTIPSKNLLDIPVTCLSFEEQMILIMRWAKMRTSKVVCLANVHMIMEAYWGTSFRKVLQQADLVTSDGMPLVWMLRRQGIIHQDRVAGMDVFLRLCDLAETSGVPIYFLGSTTEILEKMRRRLNKESPILKIAGMKSIPMMTIDEIRQNTNYELVEEINQSGAGIVFVCLGCPKQEIWMSQYQGLINGVMIGVGAVFSMYAGITPRAPYLINNFGLEWCYRLLQEPHRLWYRYGSTIPPFIFLAFKELLQSYKDKWTNKIWQRADKNLALDLEYLNLAPEKIGVILLRQNIITERELKQALLEQKQYSDTKLGEILVRNNLISLHQLKFYLKNQKITLGQLLLEKKKINQRKLKNVLSLQNINYQKLGNILIEQKILSPSQLKEVLIEQYTRRNGLYWNSNTIPVKEEVILR